ncbi:MAG TPA: 50S ribosomal protein L10, partial [Nitrospiria bacterium]
MKAVKEEKKQAVKDLHDKFSESKVAILMEFSGLSVAEMTDLRRKLRTQKGELKVVKNSLARRAVEGTGLSESV